MHSLALFTKGICYSQNIKILALARSRIASTIFSMTKLRSVFFIGCNSILCPFCFGFTPLPRRSQKVCSIQIRRRHSQTHSRIGRLTTHERGKIIFVRLGHLSPRFLETYNYPQRKLLSPQDAPSPRELSSIMTMHPQPSSTPYERDTEAKPRTAPSLDQKSQRK